jgi:predicted nucleic acid-binding protein
VSLVVDCSVANAWCIDDEASPETDALLDRVRDEGAIAPALWRLELANVLLQAERRGRLSVRDVAARLAVLDALPIVTDEEAPARVRGEVLALARAERLTAYDAAYLELALRTGADLASKDAALVRAARRAGVAVVPGES